MCYHHHRSHPYAHAIVRGLWRMVVISGLFWLLRPAAAGAQDHAFWVPAYTVCESVE
jgi:hypothetical protein